MDFHNIFVLIFLAGTFFSLKMDPSCLEALRSVTAVAQTHMSGDLSVMFLPLDPEADTWPKLSQSDLLFQLFKTDPELSGVLTLFPS